MECVRTATYFIAALLFCSQYVLSRPITSRQTLQEMEQEPFQQAENDFRLKYAILSRSSGKYLTMLENGSVFASGVPVRGQLAPSSHWYLHMSGGVHRLENVQSRDHYLAVAHREDVTMLVAHNISKPFTLDMTNDPQENISEDESAQQTPHHNDTITNENENSVSTFSFFNDWNIQSIDTLTINVKLVRDGTDCYLSFDREGYPHNNLCSLLSMGENIDLAFQSIF